MLCEFQPRFGGHNRNNGDLHQIIPIRQRSHEQTDIVTSTT